MFCKSRDTWVNLPGGLIQSVVIDECFNEAGRIDEIFYNTMVAVHEMSIGLFSAAAALGAMGLMFALGLLLCALVCRLLRRKQLA